MNLPRAMKDAGGRRGWSRPVCRIALAALPVAMLLGGTCRAAGTGEDGIRCPAGAVHIAEIRVLARQDGRAGAVRPIGIASAEICAGDATRFSDVVTRGAPDGASGAAAIGQKTGVEGSIQISGRTAQMDATVYLPLNDADLAQCAQQQDTQGQDTQAQGGAGGTCRPHGLVASLADTWVFSPGRWSALQVGTDSAGNPIALYVRISNGQVE